MALLVTITELPGLYASCVSIVNVALKLFSSIVALVELELYLSPGMPVGPVSPFSPVCPFSPVSPFSPVGPVSPLSPV